MSAPAGRTERAPELVRIWCACRVHAPVGGRPRGHHEGVPGNLPKCPRIAPSRVELLRPRGCQRACQQPQVLGLVANGLASPVANGLATERLRRGAASDRRDVAAGCQTHPMTTRRRPLSARLRLLLLTVLTALAALLLPALHASASGLPAAQTRVGAISPTVSTVVGVAEHIAAGQHLGRAPSQLRLVSGHCVAAEGLSMPVHAAGSLSNGAARAFYLDGERGIASLADDLAARGVPARERALELIGTRNALRTQSRALMADRDAADLLNMTDPNRTLGQLVGRAYGKDLAGDDLWNYLADSASRSRQSVNDSFGLSP